MIRSGTPIRVVLVTDSFLLGDGLASLLGNVPDVDIVGRTRDQHELLRMVDEEQPDAVIYGIRTSVVTTMATISVARHLRVDHPTMGFVVISDRGDGFAIEMLRGGASRVAFLLDQDLPTIDSVLASLRAVMLGESVLDPSIVESLVVHADGGSIGELTLREREVLEQMSFGLSNAAIAAKLSLSVKSIEKGVTAIFAKLGPFDPRLVDRRVSVCLEYLRTQSDPFQQFALHGTTIERATDSPALTTGTAD
jgi:DNA-binding NarL/FixJ family response regulator